jgi:hypothetical protein
MGRGSDKHGPRLDDSLRDETESMEQGSPSDSRAREERQQESPDDREPVPDSRVGSVEAALRELGNDDIEARRELARSLEPSRFPADREALLGEARAAHAREPVIEVLEGLPPGLTFESFEEIWAELRPS